VFAKVHHLAGSPAGPIPHDVGQSLLPVGGWEGQTLASEAQSWFGPIGILLVLGVGVAASFSSASARHHLSRPFSH
jgi:hypothetical protein